MLPHFTARPGQLLGGPFSGNDRVKLVQQHLLVQP
jgi:hypothetical protein